MATLNMAASTLINRAKTLADIVQSTFVTYNDLYNGLNESYRDLYELLTDSSDDYFVTLTTLNVTSSSANVPLNQNEYLVTLPTDFYKLAFIDYNYNGSWQRMRKFPKDSRNNYAQTPSYRFQGNYLWVIGGGFSSSTFQLRVGYYPMPDTLYFPNQAFYFTPNPSSVNLNDAQRSLLQYPSYVSGSLPTTYTQDVNPAYPVYNGMLLVQQGTGILYVSNQTGVTTTVISSSATILNPTYYKGNLFWVQGGNLQGGAFDPSNPTVVTPTAMTSASNMTWLDVYSGTIWAIYGGVTGSVAIPATLAAVTLAAITSPFTPPSNAKYYNSAFLGYPVWLTSAGVVTINNVATTITGVTGGYNQIFTDGTYLYVVQNKTLYRYTINIDTPTSPTVTKSEVIATDIAWISGPSQGWIGTIGYESLNVTAYSTTPDYVLTYPNNLAYEIMSYQTAINIKRKQGAKDDLALLEGRKSELIVRFMDQIRRDDYYPERISNNRNSGNPNGLFGVNF